MRDYAHDTDVKERFKLLCKCENIKELGLGGFIEKYNGKPALCTKSASIFVGDDYVEIDVNLFRYAYVTKKALQHVLPRIGEMDLHAAVTLEERDDDEPPSKSCSLRGSAASTSWNARRRSSSEPSRLPLTTSHTPRPAIARAGLI